MAHSTEALVHVLGQPESPGPGSCISIGNSTGWIPLSLPLLSRARHVAASAAVAANAASGTCNLAPDVPCVGSVLCIDIILFLGPIENKEVAGDGSDGFDRCSPGRDSDSDVNRYGR